MSNRDFTVTTGRDGRRTFGDHDDRWVDDDNRRGGGKYQGGPRRGRGGGYGGRGGYNNSDGYRKNFRGRGGGFNKSRGYFNQNKYRGGRGGSGPHPRSRTDPEGDFDMDDAGGSAGASRYNPYGRPNRSNRPSSSRENNSSGSTDRLERMGLPIKGGHASNDHDPNQWFKVTIPKGRKSSKDSILQSINDFIEVPFIPVYFHFEGDRAVFHVQDRKAADEIRRASHRISMPNGFKMVLLVKPSGPPYTEMDEGNIQKLKECMSGRYDPSVKALNLSGMHSDQGLVAENMFLALNRRNVMEHVVNIIEEHIPELEALDLSENKLMSLDNLRKITEKAPNVVRLNLGKNALKTVDELDTIKNWKIVELILDGNDLCDKFKDQSAYISAVRKKFPKVLKLDGHDLPPPIVFDTGPSEELPNSKGSFFLNTEIQTLVVDFLKKFFTVYDSDNREPLMPAYAEDAIFSLSAAYNGAAEYAQPKLFDYISESRNFLKGSRDQGRRNKLLKRGKLSIASQLCHLPKTTHDYNSFVVDVDFASEKLLSFCVCGVFKEAESRSDRPPIRSFSRRFITLPCGSSMVIANDMLTVSNASQGQLRTAFKNPAPTPSSSPVPDSSPAPPFASSGATYTQEQQQMIQSFIVDSGMNQEYSAKCLEEHSWDYQKAGLAFLEFQKQGKVPPEAFVK